MEDKHGHQRCEIPAASITQYRDNWNTTNDNWSTFTDTVEKAVDIFPSTVFIDRSGLSPEIRTAYLLHYLSWLVATNVLLLTAIPSGLQRVTS